MTLFNTTSDEIKWYPLRIRGRFERRFAEKLAEKGIEYYLPLMHERHRWSDRWKTVEKIVFPGYIFVRIPKNRKFHLLEIQWAQGFVEFRGEMASIPDRQIESIRILLDKPLSVRIQDKEKLMGKTVRIIKGPLAGLCGKVKKMANNTLVCVEVDHMDRMLSVEIDENDLQASDVQ